MASTTAPPAPAPTPAPIATGLSDPLPVFWGSLAESDAAEDERVAADDVEDVDDFLAADHPEGVAAEKIPGETTVENPGETVEDDPGKAAADDSGEVAALGGVAADVVDAEDEVALFGKSGLAVSTSKSDLGYG